MQIIDHLLTRVLNVVILVAYLSSPQGQTSLCLSPWETNCFTGGVVSVGPVVSQKPKS